jgi:iron complex transport system substrate-binding protein
MPPVAEMEGWYVYLKRMLEPKGIKVVALNFYDAKTFDRDIESLGKMLGKEEEAEDYANFAKSYTDKIGERVKDIPDEDRVHVMYDTPFVAGVIPYYISGKGMPGDQVIEMAGGINILGEEGEGHLGEDWE